MILKFGMKHQEQVLYKVYINHMKHQEQVLYKVYINHDLGMTLTVFKVRLKLGCPCIGMEKIVKMLFEGENLKQMGKRTEDV